MFAVLQFRRVFLASSLVGAGWCLPHSALAFGCVPLWVFCFVCFLMLLILASRLVAFLWCSCTCVPCTCLMCFRPLALLLEDRSRLGLLLIAPNPSRVLGTGLEVFPTPASARCSSYCLNSCEERRAAGSSGWALSGTIPTQAQSAPSSGAALFLLRSPPRVFRHRAGGLPNSSLCQGF